MSEIQLNPEHSAERDKYRKLISALIAGTAVGTMVEKPKEKDEVL